MSGFVPVSPKGVVFWNMARESRDEAILELMVATCGEWRDYYLDGWRIRPCNVAKGTPAD